MNQNLAYLFKFNVAMLFMSTSGALGRFISLPPPIIIWIRCLLAALLLFTFIKWQKIPLFIHKRHRGALVVSSIFLGIHWVTYFYALHLSNVAIAFLSIFTYPVITTLLEPLVMKTRFVWSNLFLAFLVLLGIFFMVPEFTLGNTATLGLIVGLFSATFYSFRNLMLKQHIAQYSGITLMFYQLTINALLMWPTLLIFEIKDFSSQIPALVALAILTTAIGHTLFVMSFKKFSISAVSIMSSLQPLMGILIAYLFLDEIPAAKTLIGGGLILATVVIESIRTVKS